VVQQPALIGWSKHYDWKLKANASKVKHRESLMQNMFAS